MVALLTPAQVAEELCISDRQLRKLTAKGDMPFIDIGTGKRSAPRFDPSDVQAFKAERRRISSPSSKDPARKRTAMTSGTRAPDIQELLLQRQSQKPSPSKRPSARRPRLRQSEPVSQ
jgi:excisionase family DNA binding protein